MQAEPFMARILQNEMDFRELNLAGRGLDDLGCCRLTEALKANTWLRVLDVSDNRLTDDSALFLAELLMTHPSLTALDVSRNPMTTAGGKAFVQAVKGNAVVRQLRCDGGMFDDATQREIAHWLRLNGYPIALKTHLPAVQANARTVLVLDLSVPHRDNKAYDEAAVRMVAEAVQRNTHLKSLVLDNNFKTDARVLPIIAALQDNTTITNLSLASNHIGPDGARALAAVLRHNTTLTAVNLADNEVGDGGARALLEALGENHYCRSLVLKDNAIEADTLIQMDRLLTLNTQPNELRHVLPRIAANDPDCTTLQLCGAAVAGSAKRPEDLKAYYNNLSAIVLAEALQANTFVSRLYLRDNFIGPEGAKALATMLRTNRFVTELDLRDNFITDEGARALLLALEPNPEVVALELAGNGLSPKMEREVEHAVFLNRMPGGLKETLRRLRGDPPDLTELNFSHLRSGGVLDRPNKLPVLDDRCLTLICQTLPSNTHLRRLHLAYQALTDEGAERLAAALQVNRSLTFVSLFQNPGVGDAGVLALAKAMAVNDVVREIDCDATGASPEAQKRLTEAVELNRLPLALKHLLPLVAGNVPSVRRVSVVPEKPDEQRFSTSVVKGTMNDRGCELLTAALRNNVCVTAIDLSNNQVSSYGAEELANFLWDNATVTSLNLCNNNITTDGARYLSERLKSNTVLRELLLAGNPLGEGGGVWLERLAQANDALQRLSLEGCGVSDLTSRNVTYCLALNCYPPEVKRTLLRASADNTDVTAIDFSSLSASSAFRVKNDFAARCQVDDECVEVAVHMLRANQTVTAIDLCNSALTVRGGAALATLLRRGSPLKTLRLANAQLTDQALEPVLAALPGNHTVQHFDVADNRGLSEAAVRRVAMLTALNTQPAALKPLMLRLEGRHSSGETKAPKYLRLCDYDGERYYDNRVFDLLHYFLGRSERGIELIELSDNLITDEGMPGLVRILEATPELWGVKLNRNPLTDAGAAVLLRALSSPKVTLRTLELEGCEVSEELLQQIAQRLEANVRRLGSMKKTLPQRAQAAASVTSPSQSYSEMKTLDDMILREALSSCSSLLMRTR